ncbi:MAG: efflux RND transporter periplasmic adaptor subunit [Planctomycetaceae bacterium]|nr:efflux RND transporter periplasmic adaptor subunit [Planctomycetaceae bacterium]
MRLSFRHRWLPVVLSVMALFLAASCSDSGERQGGSPGSAPAAQRILYWSCSMHPQIKAPQSGKCPICFMDLIPVYETSPDGGDGGAARLTLSQTARELAEIETAPVELRVPAATVNLSGKIELDETRLAQVAAWVGGRVDKIFVDYVGRTVAKGDPLILIYSPELRAAQEEFLISRRQLDAAKSGGDAEAAASASALEAASRRKLELWGILPSQVDELIKSGRASDQVTIYAPAGGTVIERDAYSGKYVEAGERLLGIADLSTVWAVLDAYELDIALLRSGQEARFQTDAMPGKTFTGRVVFIQPTLDEATRTIKVRLVVPNPDQQLKPGMYVRAAIAAAPAAGGQKVLMIPATAPLLTGTRAVVYVEERTNEQVSYVGHEVELGGRAGDYYIVRSGLSEGQRVVTRGNFKIDAALQIQAKPSMMKPKEAAGAATQAVPPQHQHSPTGGRP